ncbi:MAG TPA: acetyltransferase [Ferruginibacter sp.]|nr:acetyltransferase [Ferruginibacter sp.]HRO16745.1 acetyltransferase [Ferruginibacter sp.]HRQ19814.1 acetyltransferase [Ferruginibacter sp.]
MIVIGYSGHAYVACGILGASGIVVSGYCDHEEKKFNPLSLPYIGSENDSTVQEQLRHAGCFIAVGDNRIRKKVYHTLQSVDIQPVNAVHPSAVIAPHVQVAHGNVMIGAGVILNPFSVIETGAICNTAAVIEHECVVGAFAHIGPGAVLCGNVQIGAGAFVGAAAVIRQGIRIGANAMIGMGAVVVKDVADGAVVVGNPSRKINE